MAKGKKDRIESAKRLSRPARRRLQWLVGGSAAVVAAIVLGYFAYRAVADLPGTSYPDLGNAHIQTLTDPHAPYNSDPPTSGPHLPYIAPWGIHTEPIPKELQVHNLEDGGVDGLRGPRGQAQGYRPALRATGPPGALCRDEDADRADRLDPPGRVRRVR
jgi:hypothetical protein